jgi:hypothetical protein
MKTINVDGKEIPLVEPTEVIVTIKNKKTGEIYQDEEALKDSKCTSRRCTKRCIS